MDPKPKILAFDTSGRGAALALLEAGELVARRDLGGRPAEGLLAAIGGLLEEVGWELGALRLVVVGVGPGSFTGTRVGLATAKGLAFAAGLEVVGVTSLAARARALAKPAVALVANAGRGEVYAAAYRCSPGVPVEEHVAPFLASPERALERVGDGWPVFADGDLGLPVPPAPPLDAGALGFEGWLRYQAFGPDDPAGLEPSYVRPSDAKLPDEPLRVADAQASSPPPSSSASSSKSEA